MRPSHHLRRMSLRMRFLVLLFVTAACAGPDAHAVKSSVLDANAEAAPRPKVGTTLDAESPLDSPACVPTLPDVKCPTTAETQPHHHAPATVEAALVVDPVCKMKIDPKTAKGGSLELKGEKHFFCSTSCRTSFLKEHPEAK